MADALAAYIKHGFPREGANGGSYKTDIEYSGPTSSLYAGGVVIGNEWPPYQGTVTVASIAPIEGSSTHSELIVSVERVFDSSDYSTGSGQKTETNYEIDWVDVPRSLFEHPKFRVGGSGTYVLVETDVTDIEKWTKEPDATLKSTYKYQSETAVIELTTNAKMLAKGILLGIENWVDKAPVARQSETWVNGPPPEAEAGLKVEGGPDGFPNLPRDYEWIRSADRATRRGDQNKWNRDIEWLGAKKVLIDSENVFWEAP